MIVFLNGVHAPGLVNGDRSALVRFSSYLLRSLAVLCIAAAVPELLVGQHTAEIVGVVSTSDGVLRGATIQITSETGRTYSVVSDSAGRYRLAMADAGPFAITVAALGVADTTLIVSLPTGSSRRVVDVVLQQKPIALAPVRVTSDRLSVSRATRWVPGTREHARPGLELRQDSRDDDVVDAVLSLQPGVSATAEGYSVAGQAPDQTRFTLDGTGAAGIVLPREAVRSVGVVTNTFDVALSQFTGGQVAVRSQGGGNKWGFAARTDLRDSRSGSVGPGLNPHSATALSIDLAGGGALVPDRVYVFGAATAIRGRESAAGLRLAGAHLSHAEVLRRFVAETADLRPAVGDPGASRSFTTGLLRIDARLTQSHALRLTWNAQGGHSETQSSSMSVPGTETAFTHSGSAIRAVLSSGGSRFAHEFSIARSTAKRRLEPFDPVPVGRVWLDGGAEEETERFPVQFAGSATRSSRQREGTTEFSDVFILRSADHSHRVRIGVQGAVQQVQDRRGRGLGTFEFRSLDELIAGRPSRFSSGSDPLWMAAESRRLGFFADDHWRLGDLQLSGGMRADILAARAVHSREEVLLDQRSFQLLRRSFSPRVGFALPVSAPWPGGDRLEVQGGVGHFVGDLPLAGLAPWIDHEGLAINAEETCVGDAVPLPDWVRYRADPTTIPTGCGNTVTDGSGALATQYSRRPGSVLPEAVRAFIGTQGVVSNLGILGLSFSWIRGTREPVVFDRNLSLEPRFRLASEGGREIYVRPSEIEPSSGFMDLIHSRRDPTVGRVLELSGEGTSNTLQIAGMLTRGWGQLPLVGRLQSRAGATWTTGWTTVGPLDSFGIRRGSTGAHAFAPERSASAAVPRYAAFASLTSVVSPRATALLRIRWSSGMPFTPMVDSDVNGDGAANDRAFVFDPSQPGLHPEESAAIAMLAENASGHVRDCLARQRGTIAAPLSCRSGSDLSIDGDLRLSFGPRMHRTAQRRVTAWLALRNIGAGLDRLLHGGEGVKGWGQGAYVDETLLRVRSFDPEAGRFRYDVNSQFGRRMASVRPSPFTLSVQFRVVLGVDRPLADHHETLDRAADRAAALRPENVRAHLHAEVPNLPAEVLSRNGQGQLLLTPTQILTLRDSAAVLAPEIEAVVEPVVEQIRLEGEPDDLRKYREVAEQAHALRRRGIDIIRIVLSREQFRRVPRSLRTERFSFSPVPPQSFVFDGDW